jgi:hypothetical protein
MSSAILTVYHDMALDLHAFSLSAPQSVKDHINKQMEEHFGMEEGGKRDSNMCTVSGLPMYLLVSWVERNFGKLEHVSSCEGSTTYVFHRKVKSWKPQR